MTNKLTLTEQEELFAKDCKLMLIILLYIMTTEPREVKVAVISM